MASKSDAVPVSRYISACVVGWLIPGGGHWLLGMPRRGLFIFFGVTATLVLGVCLGGSWVLGWHVSKFAWVCQLCSGLPGLIGTLVHYIDIGRLTTTGINPSTFAVYGRGVDFGLVYTGIAGGLNVLALLDIIGRAEKGTQSVTPLPASPAEGQ
ncbi:MAG: hypothetical protein JW709_08150 [Sedimentisphaerales bacterium]|nr:hypothetical protein [Sedimentisphaerales bacterium]